MSTIYDDVARDGRDEYRQDPDGRHMERWTTDTDVWAMSSDDRRALLEDYANRVWLDDLVKMNAEIENEDLNDRIRERASKAQFGLRHYDIEVDL
jgi:hypothetical protein